MCPSYWEGLLQRQDLVAMPYSCWRTQEVSCQIARKVKGQREDDGGILIEICLILGAFEK